MMQFPDRLSAVAIRLSQPAYTGSNRCLPCTVVNVCLAAVGTVAVGAAVQIGLGTGGFAAAVVIGSLSLATISLRGYLVPGTPALTKRHMPEWLLARFGTHPIRHDHLGISPETTLFDVGVVVDDPAADDLSVDPRVARQWDRSIDRYWTEENAFRSALGRLVSIAPEAFEVDDAPRSYTARVDGTVLGRWPSRAACVADVAAATELRRWDPDWEARPLAVRSELLGVLRIFLEACPACDGSIALSADVVESCCRQYEVAAATCGDCGERLFEMDVDHERLLD